MSWPPYQCPYPDCGAVSHNPNDAIHGYCGRCHRWAKDLNVIPPAAPLFINDDVRAALGSLRDRAAKAPVDMPKLSDDMKTPRGAREHRARMQAQTVMIPGPWPFFVTYSLETGHPLAPLCRHVSVSIRRKARVPSPGAVKMIAELLGFEGGLDACTMWPEQLSDGGIAVNLVQPVGVSPASQRPN